jgi:hypothetical protein
VRIPRTVSFALLAAGGVTGAITACSGILGIEDPVVDGLVFSEAGPDTRVADEAGGFSEGGGGGTCVAPRADCNGGSDGCETDVTMSAAHCGACGHSCGGAACIAGRCQAQVLSSGAPILDYSGYVGVNSSRVVWANRPGRGVYSVPKAGGTFLQYFGATSFAPTTLDVHETFFVVADYDLYGVARWATAGGGNEDPRAESCATGLGAVADDTGAVYYAHLNDTGPCMGSIYHVTKRAPAGGGAYSTAWDVAVSNFSAGASKWMVLDANNLYFDAYLQPPSNPTGIYSVSRTAGGAISLVLAGGFLGSPMAIDGNTLFAIENVGGASAMVVAIDLGTKAKRPIATTDHGFLEAGSNVRAQIAVDATHVYWTAAVGADNPSVQGRVFRAKKDGSSAAAENVTDAEPSLYGMAIDESSVYWSTASAIKRIAK